MADRAEQRKAWLKTDAGRAYKKRERARYKTTTNAVAYEDERQRERSLALADSRMTGHTFVGVDGEGWTDDAGKHHYMMMVAGRDHIYTGKPLTAFDCLMFIATRPVRPSQFFVSFFFDYDTTMILRDLAQNYPAETRRLFDPQAHNQLTWFQFGKYSLGVGYRPKKHLTVKLWSDTSVSKAVTIHDVQGFFQSAFVVALDKFDIGTAAERDDIRAMKAKRGSFTQDEAPEILAYSKHECVLLEQLVSQLRDHSHTAKTNAAPYEGPGSMAQRALMRRYTKPRHAAVMERTPELIHDMARRSYYGGRFEILAHGPVAGTVYEYDLKSAYPYAMTQLPCFAHGFWSAKKETPYGLHEISWRWDGRYFGEALPFPMRGKDGYIFYPTEGHGWYWSHEIQPEYGVNVHTSRYWHQQCDHRPFDWVASLYHEREYIEEQHKGSGIAIKLMLNTLYGKTAQQRPVPGQFLNLLHASFITSLTRSRMYRAYLDAPEQSIVMFATDAIFSRTPLDIAKAHPALGEFEHASTFDDLCIFQPGVYFDGSRAAFKTRGIPKQVFRDNAPYLRAIARDFDAHFEVTLETHLGLRLALSRGTPHALSDIGNWVPITKKMTANPSHKRMRQLSDIDGAFFSLPPVNTNLHKRRGQPSTYLMKAGEGSKAESMRLDDDLISDGYYEGDFGDD